MRNLIKILASGFYAGYSPVASGTVGSLWGVLIYLLLYKYPHLLILVTFLLLLLGFLICTKAEEIFGEKDSKRIVIDEIAGICLVYLFIKPTWLILIIGFLLFRFFDIIKPLPARRLEKLPGALGIMLDDMVAAIYTILVILVIYIFKLTEILPMLYI